jgi:hypothetical protein
MIVIVATNAIEHHTAEQFDSVFRRGSNPTQFFRKAWIEKAARQKCSHFANSINAASPLRRASPSVTFKIVRLTSSTPLVYIFETCDVLLAQVFAALHLNHHPTDHV